MIQGSIVALVTPMSANGDIDWVSLDALINWHIDSGTDGIVAVGTTGESPTLSVNEHLSVIERAVQVVAGRVPVIAGTGANSTSEAVHLTSSALRLGADASLQVVPYYNKPTQEGLYQHFKAIAEAVPIPVLLYNVPGRTVADMLPETVARLAEVSNIIGIKEATGDLQRGQQVLDICPDDFIVLSGDDPTAAEFMLMGAKGDISVTANVAPREMAALCAAARAGDAETARRLDSDLQALHNALFVEPNPIPVKWAMYIMGRTPAGIRLPLTLFSEDGRATLQPVMQNMGLISV
jgi:4-hydroxy-tetrahydrodipicolinate synthase|tara:strand:+ start:69152 stop:70033 length:882 start_codon:yes stop_codon:yes gene_type:complete